MAAAADSFELLYREMSRSCRHYAEPLVLLGAAYAASRALVLLRGACSVLRVHFLPRLLPRRKLRARFGEWAVIYGVSHPVAMAYAEELARNGVSIVFIAQNQTEIRDAAASLSQNYGVETVAVLADFSLDLAAIKPIREAVAGKDVGFLVNCVDETLAPPLRLTEAPEHALLEAVSRNVAAATLMARLVLPGMVERGRGAVVNISPAACCRPRIGTAMLAASTGFVDHLSRVLQLEHGSDGLVIQSLTPLQIASSSQPRTESWLAPKADVYARHAVSTLGVSNRTTGYWPHTLQYGLIRSIPEWIWILGSRVFIGSS